MVKVSELEDGDLERIEEIQAMLKAKKSEDDVKRHLSEHGFIPYHAQFLLDIGAGRIPLEREVEADAIAFRDAEKKARKEKRVIMLIVAGVVLALIAGAILYFIVLAK